MRSDTFVSSRPVAQSLVVLAFLVSVAAVPFAAVPADAQRPQVGISNVSVSPDQPAPDQLTEIRTTITNGRNGTQAVEITDLYIRRPGGSHDIARVEDLGTVARGGELSVPLTLSFDEPGVNELRIVAVGRYGDSEIVRMQYPVTVVVNEGGPRLSIDVARPSTDGETPVSVNVSNGEPSDYRNLELVLDGTNVRVEDPDRITAVIESGAERTFRYSTTFPRDESTTIVARLAYTTPEGQTRTIEQTRTVEPSALGSTGDRPQVELSVAEAVPGATRPVNVTVANGLDSDVRQVRVVATSPSAAFRVTERVTASVASGTQKTFQFPARVSEAGTYPVNVTLVYTERGARRRVTETFRAAFEAPSNPGEIRLTDADAVERGGSLELSATAGNVGSGAVEAVVVSIGDAPKIGSADYFVGSVDASDFASFTLTASVSGNVSSVPVEVRYVVDGVEKSFRTDVPVEQVAAPQPRDGGGLPVVPIVGAVAVLVVAAAVYRWRR
jgi:hypothetical protein